MRDDGFIDLTGEDKLWRWHRVSAPILLVLLIAHLTLRLPAPVGGASSIWQPAQDHGEDYLFVGLAGIVIFHVVVGIRLFRRLCPMLWPRPGQRHLLTWCIAAERLSGFALACFLVIHLCLVAVATAVAPSLDGMIRREGGFVVTVAESVILMLLVIHGIGGIRVLLQEGLSTHRLDRPLALLAIVCATFTPLAWWWAVR